MTTKEKLLTLSLLSLFPVACGHPIIEVEPPEPQATPALLDDLLTEVARQVPGFGGAFVDEEGRLHIYLLDPGPVPARLAPEDGRRTADVLAQALKRPGLLSAAAAAAVTVHEGSYTFPQLRAFHDRLLALVMDLPGVVYTDVDEARNRVRIGLLPGAGTGDLLPLLDAAGVPRAAVLFAESPAIEPTSLRDRQRPLIGGLQIAFSGGLCTLGFPAVRGGVSGFVTNAHCVQGGATVYHQPTAASEHRIGSLSVDPPPFTGGECPARRRCRYSDSAFARLDPGVPAARGTVLGRRIVGEAGPALPGEVLEKVGRTTGPSRGVVSATCVHVNVSGTRLTHLCQSFVDAAVGPGDSGSPVFAAHGSSGDVLLYGLLWGGSPTGTRFVFSPISQVQKGDELGPLRTCAPGFPC